MKKRLVICILLVICMVGSSLGMIPSANACEEGSLYGDYKVERIEGYGVIIKKTPMRESIHIPQVEDPWLKPGDRVYVQSRVIEEDIEYFLVSMGRLGSGEVICDDVRLETKPGQATPNNPSQEEEYSGETVGKYGTITQGVTGRRNIAKPEVNDPWFERGCRVWVKEKIYYNKKWWYQISFGAYGTAHVPISTVQLECQSAPSNPSQEEEESGETVGKYGTITQGVTGRRNIAKSDVHDPEFEQGCRVWVKEKIYYNKKWWYQISFGAYGTAYVPISTVQLECQSTPSNPSQEEENSGETVGKYGKITQRVTGRRNIAKSDVHDPEFEQGCRVWVKEKIYYNKKWWYQISFGAYGTAHVPISTVQLECQYKSNFRELYEVN